MKWNQLQHNRFILKIKTSFDNKNTPGKVADSREY